MAYIDVIPLDIVKDYLGIDDTYRDAELTRMVKSACLYIEKYTNMLLIERDKVYTNSNGCVRVYDYPINTSVEDVTVKSTYNIYEVDTITLSVGYELATDVPSDLVDAGLMIIKRWFYGSENESSVSIPFDAKMILDIHKRYIV